MSIKTNLKNHVTVADFAASLSVSKAMVSKMKSLGMIPAECFEKSGRHSYVHVAKAKAALKVAPVGARGKAPVWAVAVGNKAGIARAKALASKVAA